MPRPMHETDGRWASTVPSTPTATSSSRPTCGRPTSTREYRDRALRFVLDENGLEELEIGGQAVADEPEGVPVDARCHGRPRPPARCSSTPSAPTSREAPFGSMDPDERLKVLDAEGIDAVVLYTTVGLLWEAELEDPELSQAYTRAYNRWICEFCAGSDRLVPTAHLSLGDPAAAARELERAVGEGRPGRLRRAVHPRRPAARPSRQRPGVRRRPGPRRAVRHPSDLRAAVDQGHPHGCVGEREAAPAARVGDRRPTACATSSRRCSTTACSTSSRA